MRSVPESFARDIVNPKTPLSDGSSPISPIDALMASTMDKRKAAGRIATQRHIVAESFTQFINLDWLFRLPIHIRIFGRAVILPEPARKRIADRKSTRLNSS